MSYENNKIYDNIYSMKEKIITFLSQGKIKFGSKDDLILFFAGKLTKTPKEIKKIVEAMISRGEIYEKRKGEFVVVKNTNIMKGKISGTNKGYAFFVPLDKTKEDFFISERNLKGAMDGDLVLVKPIMETEKSTEGEVVSILENANKTVVGTITYVNGKNAFVIPDNKKLPSDVFVPKKFTLNAKQGYRVVVKINKSKSNKLTGEVVEILGESDDIFSLEMGIIREHKLYEIFPKSVLDEARKIPQKVLNLYNNRVDLRKEKIFTIDGADAKDLDDAVSISKKGKNYVLGVHIADVGNYVKYNSELDKEAYTRGTSVYFPNMVLPMLPKELSNGICSLNENEDRYTLSVEMEITPNGDIVAHKIFESVICSCHRLTYDQVYKVLCGDKDESKKLKDIKDDLLLMNELSHILGNRRKMAGALDLDIAESYIEVDENFNVSFVNKRERNDAHKLIENFMVVCNEAVAKEFRLRGIPFVYRIHEKPVVEKIKNVCIFLQGLGLKINEIKEISPLVIQEILKQTEDKPYKEIANKVLLRSMQKARYLNEPVGHFGLALEDYCHFTSPIRRYPDLVIHRIIKEFLNNKKISNNRKLELNDFVLDASFRSSETEKNADEAERDVDDLFKAIYIKNCIGQEFDGIISGVQNYGFFVELENTVEGLVKIETLPQDFYLYMEKSLKLKGNNHTYSIGDKVRVKVVNSNVFERKIDFILAENAKN